MSDEPDAFARFGPGGATALVGQSLVSLLVSAPTQELVDRLWSVVGGDGTFDAALTTLGARGFEGLPPLAVLGWVGGTARVVVRGAVQVELFAADALVATILGGDVHSWAEHAVVGPDRAVLRSVADGVSAVEADAVYRVDRGVVPADVIEVLASRANPTDGGLVEVPAEIRAPFDHEGADEGVRGEPRPVELGDDVPLPGPLGEIEHVVFLVDEDDDVERPEPVGTDGDDEAPRLDEAPPVPVAVPLPPPAVVDLSKDAAEPTEVDSGPSAAAPRSAVTIASDELWDAGSPDSAVSPTAATDDGYDHLFGATEYRSVEDAAVRPDDPPVAADASVAPGAASTDHDGRTITMSELDAARDGRRGPAPVSEGADGILAVRCADGHLNPPHADACRACGAEIFTQSPVRLDRLDLGILRFSHGVTVQLAGPLLIGRSPKLSGPLNGAVPELVSVPSPEQDISRTHLEVRVEGWRVMVVDRGSTNGTVVVLPGRAPQRLRPDEPFPLPPGARVSLAEEVEFTFEVPR